MKMKLGKLTRAMTAVMLGWSAAASAQGTFSRAGSWDLYIGPQYVESKTLHFDGGARAELEDSASLLFGFGYHPNRALCFDFMFSSASADYVGIARNAAGDERRFVSDMTSSSFSLGATYYILPTKLTPFVSAIIGYTYIDSGVENGEYYDGCWWDPWYGYECYSYAKTYNSTKFNYGIQAGLRYDFTNHVFVRGSIGTNITDMDSSNTAAFTTGSLVVGFSFR